MEASAKTGVNAQELFVCAAKLLYKEQLKYQPKDDIKGNEEKAYNSMKKNIELNKIGEDDNPNNEGCC